MSVRNLAAIAGALMLSASAALAQDANYNSAAYVPADTETVTVQAPNIQVHRDSATGQPDAATLSRRVAFNDLDLSDPNDARELRQRVRDTAHDICETLHDGTSLRAMPGTSCYRDALKDAMPRVESIIREARYSARYR